MPVTVTFSLKLTWIETVAPALYEPLAVDELTLLTVGAVVSMTIAFLAAEARRRRRASAASASRCSPPASLIVPPLSASEFVADVVEVGRVLTGTDGVGERQTVVPEPEL